MRELVNDIQQRTDNPDGFVGVQDDRVGTVDSGRVICTLPVADVPAIEVETDGTGLTSASDKQGTGATEVCDLCIHHISTAQEGETQHMWRHLYIILADGACSIFIQSTSSFLILVD